MGLQVIAPPKIIHLQDQGETEESGGFTSERMSDFSSLTNLVSYGNDTGAQE